MATVATRDLIDISSESEAESSEPKKMELKRAETLAAAKDHKRQMQLRKKHPLRENRDSDSEIEITDELLIEKDKDPSKFSLYVHGHWLPYLQRLEEEGLLVKGKPKNWKNISLYCLV